MAIDLSTPESLAQAHAEAVVLLDALPGKADNEVMLDWPCEGQASLVWWDIPHAEILAREDLHHFEGMDFKVIHDEGETDSPVWKLFAASPTTTLTLIAALDALTTTRQALAEAEAERDRLLALGAAWEERGRYCQDAAMKCEEGSESGASWGSSAAIYWKCASELKDARSPQEEPR